MQDQIRVFSHFGNDPVSKRDEEELSAFAPREFHGRNEIAIRCYQHDRINMFLQRQ